VAKKRLFWIVALLLAFLVTAGVAYGAYAILTITGIVTVSKPITITPETFEIGTPEEPFYPAMTFIQELLLENAGPEAIDVDFASYTVDPIDAELTVTLPTKVTVPGNGSTTAEVEVVASQSLAPGTFSITIGPTR